MIKLTKFEHDLLKTFTSHTQHVWIARDENGDLFMFLTKPRRNFDMWLSDGLDYINIFGNFFRFVKWDDEPYNSYDILQNCEVSE